MPCQSTNLAFVQHHLNHILRQRDRQTKKLVAKGLTTAIYNSSAANTQTEPGTVQSTDMLSDNKSHL